MTDPALWSDIAGIVGVLLLAVPAWHVGRYALKAARFAGIRRNFDAALQAELDATAAELEAIGDRWSYWKFALFVAGTFAAALSYAIPLLARFLA
ncbi:hypothetical protein [Oceanibacterium hippocampi]|uniref:Uncharacterized protein n=1 Tax=Oceanibacterium hippocampi TaxID=745714 RepID=A0A1Y5S7C1_9PROT|nr:hypothetical protein [Oceanibacterium hippocampi]SLN33841.1 hypothetical protein OCH7691_01302 [Oceanibacterium hippocampi]